MSVWLRHGMGEASHGTLNGPQISVTTSERIIPNLVVEASDKFKKVTLQSNAP